MKMVIMATNQVANCGYNAYSDQYITNYISNNNYAGLIAIQRSYGEFANMIISAACKTIEIKVANGTTGGCVYNEKAKIISCVELNLSTFASDMPGYNSRSKEGEPYTYFTRGAYDTAVAKRWVPRGSYGNGSYYWTRSKKSNNSNTAWIIDYTGAFLDKNIVSYMNGVVPIVRLGSMIWDK
jgi:hypothetical protein